MRSALARRVARIEAAAPRPTKDPPILAAIRRDPARLLELGGMPPDPWQAHLLRCRSRRMLLLCSRQAGKSTVAAALALRSALLEPPALVLILSPTERQSAELLGTVRDLWSALGRPVPARMHGDRILSLVLANGSRIIALPGRERGIRGYSGAALLVIDEAARVDDGLYYSVRPMLAVSGGRLVGLSTPFGKRGWYHDEWMGTNPWERVEIPADRCPRIPAEFLAEERRALGERWYRQEYECSFEDAVDSVFSYADVNAALRDDVRPLFEG